MFSIMTFFFIILLAVPMALIMIALIWILNRLACAHRQALQRIEALQNLGGQLDQYQQRTENLEIILTNRRIG